MLEIVRGRLLAAEPEGEPDRECYRNDDAREQGLDERSRNVELRERREKREYPDCIAGHLADESGRGERGGSRASGHNSFRRFGDYRGDEQDERRDNHLRKIPEHDGRQEGIHLSEAEYLQ